MLKVAVRTVIHASGIALAYKVGEAMNPIIVRRMIDRGYSFNAAVGSAAMACFVAGGAIGAVSSAIAKRVQ